MTSSHPPVMEVWSIRRNAKCLIKKVYPSLPSLSEKLKIMTSINKRCGAEGREGGVWAVCHFPSLPAPYLYDWSTCPDVSWGFTWFRSDGQSLPIIPIMFMIYWISGGRKAVICLCQQGKSQYLCFGEFIFRLKTSIYELVLRKANRTSVPNNLKYIY